MVCRIVNNLKVKIFQRKSFASMISLMLMLLLMNAQANAAPKAELLSGWDTTNESSVETIDHLPWQHLLDKYLSTDKNTINRFDYRVVSADDNKVLNNYLIQLQSIDPRDYASNEQKAYWINLYNALTVQLILKYYPIETIRDLGRGWFSFGPWDDKLANVAGQSLTLNDIEHRILRPIWRDDRIHFAVNCASIGCPDLQPQVFTARNIENLLDAAAQQYLSHPRGVSFNTKGQLVLSSLFDWYGDDFGDKKRERLKRLGDLLGGQQGEKLAAYQGSIKYRYDWRLNDLTTE